MKAHRREVVVQIRRITPAGPRLNRARRARKTTALQLPFERPIDTCKRAVDREPGTTDRSIHPRKLREAHSVLRGGYLRCSPHRLPHLLKRTRHQSRRCRHQHHIRAGSEYWLCRIGDRRGRSGRIGCVRSGNRQAD